MQVRTRSYSGFRGFGEDPPAIDVSSFSDWLVNASIPQSIVDVVTDRLIQNEDDLRATFSLLNTAWGVIQAQGQGVPQEYLDAQNQYRELWAAHQIHKFYAYLVPQFRVSLEGFTKPPSLSVVRANSDVASFIQHYFDGQMQEFIANGTFLNGYAAYGLEPISSTALAIGIAGGIVAILAAIWLAKDVLATLRTTMSTWLISRQQALVREGKAPADSVNAVAVAVQEAVTNPKIDDPFKAAGGLVSNATWLVAGLALLLIGPKLVSAFSSKRA